MARTAGAGGHAGVAIEHRLLHYVVEPGGGYRLMVEEVRTIAGPEAIREHGRYPVAYDPVRDSVVAIDAYTHKPDGRRVPVRPDRIHDRQAAAFPGTALSGNLRHKLVDFPDPAAGDRLVVRYAIDRRTPLLAGHFDDLVAVPFQRVRDLQVVYDMPAGMPLQADAAGFVAVPDAPSPGRLRYRWRWAGGADASVEAGAVSAVDQGRRLAVSTFTGYPALAAAFGRAAFGRAALGSGMPAPAIAATARQVVDGLPDAHARALALSGWVGRTVRDPGGGMRAAMLVALLDAAGIDSTPALVNDGNIYTLPDAPTLGVLNHAIVHVPSLGLYLDPAADAAGAGTLPSGILGKPALLVKTGGFAMTPLLQPQRVTATAMVDVGAGRAASGVVAVPPEGKSAVLAAVRRMTLERDRRQEYVCSAVDAEDDTGFRLPKGVRVVALPRPVNLMDGGITYSARYVREAGAVLVRRRITFRHGRPTCSPADWRAMRPVLERVERDLRSRIVVAGK